MKLQSGLVVQKGKFKLLMQIQSLDGFWHKITTKKVIFARHRIYPTAFFMSWHIKTVKQWIDNGWFYTVIDLRDGNI